MFSRVSATCFQRASQRVSVVPAAFLLFIRSKVLERVSKERHTPDISCRWDCFCDCVRQSSELYPHRISEKRNGYTRKAVALRMGFPQKVLNLCRRGSRRWGIYGGFTESKRKINRKGSENFFKVDNLPVKRKRTFFWLDNSGGGVRKTPTRKKSRLPRVRLCTFYVRFKAWK